MVLACSISSEPPTSLLYFVVILYRDYQALKHFHQIHICSIACKNLSSHQTGMISVPPCFCRAKKRVVHNGNQAFFSIDFLINACCSSTAGGNTNLNSSSAVLCVGSGAAKTHPDPGAGQRLPLTPPEECCCLNTQPRASERGLPASDSLPGLFSHPPWALLAGSLECVCVEDAASRC